jgi:hypothetical protein
LRTLASASCDGAVATDNDGRSCSRCRVEVLRAYCWLREPCGAGDEAVFALTVAAGINMPDDLRCAGCDDA